MEKVRAPSQPSLEERVKYLEDREKHQEERIKGLEQRVKDFVDWKKEMERLSADNYEIYLGELAKRQANSG